MLRSGLFIIFSAWTATAAAEPFRQTWTSTTENVSAPASVISSAKITPDCPTKWSAQKRLLHGGKQEGVELIVIDNGKLRITLIPARGMGVLDVVMGDIRLGWDSPVKEIIHPRHINLHSRGGLGWLDGFNEWMCRCGLENNGQPGIDKFINNVGDEASMELTLHGKIANLPAQEVEVVVEREAPYRITVRGRVDEKMFYGPKLELHTEVSTEPGSNSFRIADVITNQGASPQEFEILYHANYGRPLLEAGSRFVGPVETATPFNARAATGVADYSTYEGPQLGFIEQVYLLRLFGDKDGRTVIMLQNKARDKAVSMAYSLKELPYLTIWKNTAAERDGYVTGLEPGTNYPQHRRIERKFGRVPKLAGGASYKAAIDYGIHASQGEVQGVAERISAIQGNRKPVIAEKPAAAE